MSEFSSSAPLRDDRGPTWILLFLAGVMFQIKKELLQSPHTGWHAHQHHGLLEGSGLLQASLLHPELAAKAACSPRAGAVQPHRPWGTSRTTFHGFACFPVEEVSVNHMQDLQSLSSCGGHVKQKKSIKKPCLSPCQW